MDAPICIDSFASQICLLCVDAVVFAAVLLVDFEAATNCMAISSKGRDTAVEAGHLRAYAELWKRRFNFGCIGRGVTGSTTVHHP